ncbi:MAG: FHA domain-containing protein [Sandaracinaceae bacterium]
MNHDHNRKTLRQFQCRDYLWEIFEQMSGELECSVDYLINEAMRQYARSRNYGSRTPGPMTPGAIPTRSGGPAIPSAPPPPPPRGAAYGGSYGSSGPPPSALGYPPPASSTPGPPPSFSDGRGGYPPPPERPAYPQAQPPGSFHPPTRAPSGSPSTYRQAPSYTTPSSSPGAISAPPPLPGAGAVAPAGLTPLFVIFNGQKLPVVKDEFIIGRGSKTADLPIKDGNISRRHAAVIWQNGAWFVKDLGSTNGVEFNGRKIDSKRVEEGDIFQLCDYEIRFTYR